ncbi:hypothetical protein B566_EDAN011147 [Ephemera danica]|nr:hypothetical protein B566_EDAN011147 [Ephemera danica]
MVLITLNNDADFDEAVKLPTLSVVHFGCNWSAQCQHMNTILEAESERIKDAKFYFVDAESAFTISHKYNIVAVPTFLLFRNNKQVERVDGTNAEELATKIDALLKKGDEEDLPTPVGDAEQALHNKLKTLTNLYPVMLFMKGTKDEPKCGFSRQIIEILNELEADYQCFNILGNEEVRQGLKTFSNWPTYPQLYIKGELVGGLDIVREMKEIGELQSMLPKKLKLEDRLAALIREHRCMVFMKGDRNNPKCGFSRQLIQMLQATGSEFKTFDILEDEEVRQGLKTFSNWPTYPQVYIDGELVGGLDILKELQESGELNSVLKIQS